MSLVIGGLDIATVTGAAYLRDGKITTQTFRAAGKKRFLDRDDDKSLDAVRMGQAGRSFEEYDERFLGVVDEVRRVRTYRPPVDA